MPTSDCWAADMVMKEPAAAEIDKRRKLADTLGAKRHLQAEAREGEASSKTPRGEGYEESLLTLHPGYLPKTMT